MQIIPAIDLKNNKCVRLSKGVDKTSEVFNNDPEEQAKYFQNIGCKKIHIVDLDSAFGRPEVNIVSIKKIRNSVNTPIQLGGGIRTIQDAQRYFDLGIDNLIIGSMSVNNQEEVKFLSNKHKNKIYISLDIQDEQIMVKGWKEKSLLKPEDIIQMYNNSNVKGYIITDIKNDGMLRGLDPNFIKNITNKIEENNSLNKVFIIAGGLTNYDDLDILKKLKLNNLEGIISGKSFYTGKIDLKIAQNILDKNG